MKALFKSKSYRIMLAYEALSAFYMTGFISFFILYLTKTKHYENDIAFALMGIVGAIRYSLPIVTGKVTDLYLNPNIAIIFGAILQFLGMFIIFILSDLLIGGLAFIAIGYSFLKPNLTVVLGKLFDEKKAGERDSGFALFYSLGNLGGFLAPLAYGFIGTLYGWEYGFGLSAACLALFLWVALLASKNSSFTIIKIKKEFLVKSIAITIIIFCSTFTMLYYVLLSQYIVYISIVIMAGFFLGAIKKAEQQAQKNYMHIFFIVLVNIIFFTFFEQQFFFLPLFIHHYVDAKILGFQIPTPWFNAINPLVVIIVGTILSKYWLRDDIIKKQTTYFSKVYIAFIFLSVSFFVIAYGVSISHKSLSSIYIIISYIFCSLGEILLVPASLSFILKLSEKKQKSFFIGVFYLTMACAQPLAGYVSSLATLQSNVQGTIPLDYVFSFSSMGGIILIMLIFLYIIKNITGLSKTLNAAGDL